MSTFAGCLRPFRLHHWLDLPPSRAACVGHFVALAATLAAAKVLLATVGVALFLANEGPGRLPLFYIGLAGVAISLSFVLGAVVDRVSRVRLARAAFAGVLIGAGALRVTIALEAPGAYFVLLASAHIFEIVLDILFWVVAAAYLDSLELKRATPFIYMALALGGAAGGVLARALSPLLAAPDLLLLLLPMAAVVAAQVTAISRRLCEVPDPDGDGVDGDAAGLRDLSGLLDLIRSYPLSFLIALNALVLTILYGLSEYLVFSIYEASYPDEQELTRFLAVVFACLQVVEFGLLYALTRRLLERAGPLVRNMVFPFTSLLCLVYLVTSQRLGAAILTHVNAEAISNAVFQPVNNTNYVTLPLRFQGRARTLADGVFYPSGLAIAGMLLLLMQDRAAPAEVGFVAIVFALVFLVLNVGVGTLFLPTLFKNLRSGIAHFADLRRGVRALPDASAQHTRALLASADPELRALGLGLARRHAPALVLEHLKRLAPGADRTTRRLLAEVLSEAASAHGRTRALALVDEIARDDDEAVRLIALEVGLVRRRTLSSERLNALRAAPSPRVRALAQLVAIDPAADRGPEDPRPRLEPLLHNPDVAADVVDAIAHARREDLLDLLAGALEAAPPAQQRRGLAVLRELGPSGDPGTLAAARRLLRHRDPMVRAEAVGCAGAHARTHVELTEVAALLDDASPAVRRHAAEALAAQGERGVDLLAARLSTAVRGGAEAARALARIDTRHARALLTTCLARTAAEAERNAALLRGLEAQPERSPSAALALALEDHDARIVDLAMGVLAASGHPRLVDRLRLALRARDQRTRANAFEALLALPDRRFLTPIVTILNATLLRDANRAADANEAAPSGVVAAAEAAADPWVRQAARLADGRTAAGASPARAGDDVATLVKDERCEGAAMTPNERDMERIVILKGVPLFRYLPLDTLLAVGRVLESRRCRAGQEVVAEGARLDHLHIVESGAVALESRRGVDEVAAPGCFGEAALVGELPTFRRVVAIEDGALLRLHRVVFEDLARDHPEIVTELSRLLARRLRQLHERGDSAPAAG